MDAFKGSYTRTSADQYEEFLKVSTPQMDITEDAGTWSIKTSTTLKTMELNFKVTLPSSTTTPPSPRSHFWSWVMMFLLLRNCIQDQLLPMNPELAAADRFTACLTTPIKMRAQR